MPEAKLLYLDASALVKLVLPEAESPALAAALDGEARLVSSEIAEVEVLRAVGRAGGRTSPDLARDKLENVRLLGLNRRIRGRACELEPVALRALDAIHIATALDLGELLDGFYTYDVRLAEAAEQVGLRVLAPSEDNQER